MHMHPVGSCERFRCCALLPFLAVSVFSSFILCVCVCVLGGGGGDEAVKEDEDGGAAATDYAVEDGCPVLLILPG